MLSEAFLLKATSTELLRSVVMSVYIPDDVFPLLGSNVPNLQVFIEFRKAVGVNVY